MEEKTVAEAIESVAYQIQYLGNGNASTNMGAIEAFTVALTEALTGLDHSESLDRMADQIERVADATRESLGMGELAVAIETGAGRIANAIYDLASALRETHS